MADTDEQVTEGQIQAPPEGEATENAGEGQAAGSSPAGEDYGKRLSALEEQLARQRERNEALERSLHLQDRFLESRQQETRQSSHEDDKLSEELAVLDRALDPVLGKRLKTVIDPINSNYNALREDNDSMRFEMFISRNHPELLEDEDAYNATMQQVEQIRQAAQQRGMNVSRVDAFVFNEGIQGTKQKIQQRKQKRSSAQTAESRRSAEVAAATGTTGSAAAARPSAIAGIQAIRDKANRGERLTPDERVKLKEFVSNVEI